jgi:hypothetical protein
MTRIKNLYIGWGLFREVLVSDAFLKHLRLHYANGRDVERCIRNALNDQDPRVKVVNG